MLLLFRVSILTGFLLGLGSKRMQAQAYQPIQFDTSCYWVSRYDFQFTVPGYPIASCKGYICSVVDKDTLIAGQIYWKLRTYVSSDEQGTRAKCLPLNDFVHPQYLHEDTTNHRIDFWMQGWTAPYTFRNYNLQAGDTLWEYPSVYHLIDSVTYTNLGGITRRLQWYRVAANMLPVYTIEGVGSLHNWPWAYYFGADYPAYKLTCFMRGSTKVYPPWTPDTCGKAAPLGLSYAESSKPVLLLQGRRLFLDHVQAGDYVEIFHLNGQSLFRETLSTSSYQVNLPIQWPAGLYILTLHGQTGSLVQRVMLGD